MGPETHLLDTGYGATQTWGTGMERLYMETQVGLKMTALTLFLNIFFHFLPAAALCDDFSLVDSIET